MSQLIRILIADDQALIREGLHGLLDLQPEFKVIGEAATCAEAVHLARRLKPDITLLDLRMPDATGLEALSEILDDNPDARVIILTGFMDEDVVLQAIQHGAAGYLLKTASTTELVRGIRAAFVDGAPLHAQAATILLRELNHPSAQAEPVQSLTARERQILYLLAKGYSNHKIAIDLSISPYTVSTHVGHILKKLKLANRTQAALYGQKFLQKLNNASDD